MLTVGLLLLANPFADLEGNWGGALQYRDYRSDKLVELPMAVSAQVHGPVLVQKLTFTDPGYKVLRVSTTVFDEEAMQLHETYSQSGSVSAQTSDVTFEEMPGGWRMVATYQGTDNDQPATIRIETHFTGDSLSYERTVDQHGDGKEEYLFRNRVDLKRQ